LYIYFSAILKCGLDFVKDFLYFAARIDFISRKLGIVIVILRDSVTDIVHVKEVPLGLAHHLFLRIGKFFINLSIIDLGIDCAKFPASISSTN
jgi:hypothetical protein